MYYAHEVELTFVTMLSEYLIFSIINISTLDFLTNFLHDVTS
jgi:hypothetical protein